MTKTVIRLVPTNSFPEEKQVNLLSLAIKNNKKKLVRAYIKNNISLLNKQNKDGLTPLQVAIIADNVDIFRMLLEAGADPNAPDRDGNTPLALLCCFSKENAPKNERYFMYSLIVENGADIKEKNRFEFDPIDIAKMFGRNDLVDLSYKLEKERDEYTGKTSVEGFYSDLSSASVEVDKEPRVGLAITC